MRWPTTGGTEMVALGMIIGAFIFITGFGFGVIAASTKDDDE